MPASRQTPRRQGPARARGAVDRRLAARRRALAAAQVRRRRRQVLLGTLAFLAALGLWQLVRSPLFGLTGVTVTGTSRLSPEEVVAAAGVRRGQPVLSVDEAAVRARVEAMTWVRAASVRRDYPAGLRIHVTERRPAAKVAGRDGRWWLVAADGVVLAPAGGGGAPAGLPMVREAPLAAPVRPGDRLPAGGAVANALAALRGLRPELARQVRGVHAPSIDGLWFRLASGAQLMYGLAAQQAAKDTAALMLLDTARKQGKQVIRIDVRAPSRPTLLAARNSRQHG